MNPQTLTETGSAIELLRGLARKRQPLERCELCCVPLAGEHQHLIDPVKRSIVCACDACSLLFDNRGETKFKRIPRRVRFLPHFQLSDAQWESLMIPINMAFIFQSTPEQRMVALYPSPGGAVESLLTLDSWSEIILDNEPLREMQPDVEALLVNRTAREYYLAPIDECFKLVGIIRTSWRGLSGGTEVWKEIAKFFDALKEKSCRT